LLGKTSSLVMGLSSQLHAACRRIAKVRGSGSDLSKLDSASKRVPIGASHNYPKGTFVRRRRRPWLAIRAVAGGDERDFDHGSAPRPTRTRTGAVGLPKRSIRSETSHRCGPARQAEIGLRRLGRPGCRLRIDSAYSIGSACICVSLIFADYWSADQNSKVTNRLTRHRAVFF